MTTRELIEKLKPKLSYYMLWKALKPSIKYPDTVWRWYNNKQNPREQYKKKLENILEGLSNE